MQRLKNWVGVASLVLGALAAHAVDARLFGGMDEVSLSSLPVQAQEVHRLIHAGGPFAYGKDGSVFGNRERILPRETRGFYREYTVRTPGSRDRGARRIVCGGKAPANPDVCYYTQDHYASFVRIAP